MTEYALLNTSDDSLVKTREIDGTPPDVSHKGWAWVPVVRDAQPSFDPATQNLVPDNGFDDPNYVFGWGTPDKTSQEQTDYQQTQDIAKVRNSNLQTNTILIRLVQQLLADGTISASDFDAEVVSDYQDIKASVDRLR